MHDPVDGMSGRKNLDPLGTVGSSLQHEMEAGEMGWPVHKQIPGFITVCGNKKTIMDQLATS